MLSCRKTQEAIKFRSEIGSILVHTLPGNGTKNDASHFFKDPLLTAVITGLNETPITHFGTNYYHRAFTPTVMFFFKMSVKRQSPNTLYISAFHRCAFVGSMHKCIWQYLIFICDCSVTYRQVLIKY